MSSAVGGHADNGSMRLVRTALLLLLLPLTLIGELTGDRAMGAASLV